MIDSVEDAEAVSELLNTLKIIAESLELLATCVHEGKDGVNTLKIQIPDPIIAYDRA